MEDINLKEIFNYFISKIWIVIILLLLATSSMFIYTNYMQIPLYKSSTTLVLVSQNGELTQNDVTLNQKLVSTYKEIIRSRRILEQVVNNLTLTETWQEVQKNVSVKVNSNTEIISISVSNEDSNKAYLIANEIAKVFSNEIVNIYNIDNVTILEYPTISQVAYNINLTKQMVLAALAGIVLGSGIILVMFYFDTTIKSSEDIEKKLGLIVLGSVPKSKMTSNKTNKQEIKNIEPIKEIKKEEKEEVKKTTTTKKSTKKGVNK